MTPPKIAESYPSRLRIPAGYLVIVGVLLFYLLFAYAFAGFFRLSSDTAVLGKRVMESVPGTWDKLITVHLGGFSFGLVRTASGFFRMPEEARAAFQTVHGAEVGIYKLRRVASCDQRWALMGAADEAMGRRGWVRAVGVRQKETTVAVYLPAKDLPTHRVKCCVMVLNGEDLILASGRANLEPLMELARKQIDKEMAKQQHLVAQR